MPALFIRTSGCTRACDFCDTKYHVNGKQIAVSTIVKKIKESGLQTIIWTGGEPLLQQEEIHKVISKLENNKKGIEYKNHLETNGDKYLIHWTDYDYICFSPKDEQTTRRIFDYVKPFVKLNLLHNDIKIVTDLETLNLNLIKYATILMPLTTNDEDKNLKIQKDVWNYCIENNIKYTPRIHRDVWGNKRGV